MNLKTVRPGILLMVLAAGISITSCKGDKKDDSDNTRLDTSGITNDAPATQAPVEIATDDSLNMGVKDAIKDFPGVTATVTNGEVTLDGGPVTKDQLQTIMQSVQSLHPKKVNNNLSVK